MARSSRIRVMISSRCNDFFPAGQTSIRLSEVRKALKKELEEVDFLGKKMFEVWINEETPPKAASWDSWDVCMNAVKDCDVLIAICNGNAGWAQSAGDLGICHAELMTGLSTAPGKVYLIALNNIPITSDDDGKRNKKFQDYVAKQNLFRGDKATTVDALKKRVKEALREAVISLTQSGVREASRGKAYSGAALDWSRLDFKDRQAQMVRVLREAIGARKGATEQNGAVAVQIGGQEVLCSLHAIPASLSVSAARELVGQPFLRDHLLASDLKSSRGGPLHLIACNKAATESQALNLLGFPDATIVAAPFGIFVADSIQKVQFTFLTNCRDEGSTRHGLQRFFEWLNQTGEDARVAARAKARARIVRVVAREAKQ